MKKFNKIFLALALTLGIGVSAPVLSPLVQAQSNFSFLGSACQFPASVSPVVRFRMDTFTGSSGNANLTLTQLGSYGTNATVGGASPPTITATGPNGTSALHLVSSSVQYMVFGTTVVQNNATAHDDILVFKYANQVPSNNYQALYTYCTVTGTPGSESYVAANAAGYVPFYWGGGNVSGASVGISGYDYYSAWQYFLGRFNGGGDYRTVGNWTAYKNGASQTLGASGTVNSSGCNNYIGAYASGFLITPDADIAEIITLPTMDAGQKTDVEAYLTCRYGSL